MSNIFLCCAEPLLSVSYSLYNVVKEMRYEKFISVHIINPVVQSVLFGVTVVVDVTGNTNTFLKTPYQRLQCVLC